MLRSTQAQSWTGRERRYGHARGHCLRLCLVLLTLLSLPGRAAQFPASGELAPGHWAVRAAAQLSELGLVTPYLPAQNAVPLQAVRAALVQAVAEAEVRRTPSLQLARAYLARFDAEFSGADQATRGPVRLQGISLSSGAYGLTSRARPGKPGLTGTDSSRAFEPLRMHPDVLTPTLASTLRAQVTPYFGLSLAPQLEAGQLAVSEWEVAGSWAGLGLSLGRAPVSYGLEGQRSFVLSGAQPLSRLELQTLQPFQLPGFLRHLGHFSVHSFLTRLHDARHVGQPFLWGASVRAQPHPRLTLALQRGVMIGDGIREVALTPRRFLKMVFATKNQFENNVMGLSARWQMPTEAVLPLTAYTEWGADDLGAQFKAPGLLVGLRSPSLPALPAVSLGGEFTFLGAVCCRTFQWYSHHIHRGGWVSADEPLGHPLGGDGREYRLYGRADLLDARLRVEADVFLRQRFLVNLYSPFRAGTGMGLASSIAWRVKERAELGVRASGEGGAHWHTADLAVQLTLFF